MGLTDPTHAGRDAVTVLLSTVVLAGRELKVFARQRSRIAGALLTPVVFWLLLGAGLRASFRPPGVPADLSYPEYFLPGVVLMIVLFTSIFSTISVIEDRKSGFLQAVLAAPVPRAGIVLGKVAGGSLVAVIQAGLFLALAPFAGISLSAVGAGAALCVLLVTAVGLTSLGFLLAWRLESTQAFHAIMNLFLMPMWLLSGAFFPSTGATGWVRGVMTANPMTYGLAALRRSLYWGDPARAGEVPSWTLSLGVLALFSIIMLVGAKIACERIRHSDS